MPGIVGLIAKLPRVRAEQELLRMLETIRHDSSFVTGTWVDESLGVYVGWAVRSGSLSDGMLLRNERGDVTLVFSGEEFPEPGIRRRLRGSGHTIEAEDPSCLVHVYEEDPTTFPLPLNGWFHGLVEPPIQG